MARKLRLEFPGACYHVINRGNYRRDVFETDASKDRFETCLFEACAKSNWRLKAYVIMSNHFHLAVETPDGNLVTGMQWLQGTFANRYNRRRDERGHLFQGRYKSILLEPGTALGQVCHYIHLNPVRAGILPIERLGDYRYSSYWRLTHPKHRPSCLDLTTTLSSAGDLADDAAGWVSYSQYLEWLVTEDPDTWEQAFDRMTVGWARGAADFKQKLLDDHDVTANSRAWTAAGAEEIRELRHMALLEAGLGCLGQLQADAARERKSAPWKVALAAWMKQKTQVTNRWLCEKLHMGTPVAVSHHVSQLHRTGGSAAPLLAQLEQKTLNIKT